MAVVLISDSAMVAAGDTERSLDARRSESNGQLDSPIESLDREVSAKTLKSLTV
jgi:hypothetical protein